MKRPILSLALIVVSGSLALTACKKSDGGGSEIQGVAAKPNQPAKPVDTKAQETLKDENGKIIPVQEDPQKANVSKEKVDCAFNDGTDEECVDDVGDTDTAAVFTPRSDTTANDNSDGTQDSDHENEGGTNDPAETKGTTAPPKQDPAISTLPENTGEGGGVKWLSRYFTAASGDGYRDHLTALMTAKMSKSKDYELYRKNADTIQRVKVMIEGDYMQVTFDYLQRGVPKVNILGGKFDAEKGAARLSLINDSVKKQGNNSPFGNRAMSGAAVCADIDKSVCHTVIVRIVIGESKTPLWVLVRSTNADIGISERKDLASGSPAKVFYDYFHDTKLHILESVKTVVMDSFEVVHGASGMKINVIMQDNQVVSARGQLLAPRESILTNVAWDKEIEVEDLVAQADPRTGFKTKLQNSIKSVHLITNDGRREFTLNYSFLRGDDQDVTYSRLQPEIRDLDIIGRIFRAMNIQTEI